MENVSMSSCIHFISEILHVLKTTNQYEEVLHVIVDRITRMYKCQTCAVVLIDPKTEYLRIGNNIGLSHTYCKSFQRTIATGRIGELLWTGNHVLITDARLQHELARTIVLEQEFESCACVQIAVDRRALGYLHADSKNTNTFGEDDVQILQTFADFAAVAINKATLHEENLRLETVDKETGLEKLPSFLTKLNGNMVRATQFNERFATVILDVDNFKTIINTYGYDSSKAFLKELGDLVKERLRSIDAGGRYGFDEIIIGLANTDLRGAAAYASELRKTIEEAKFTRHGIETTVSIGVAAYPQNGRSFDDVLLAAKRALLEAQRAGRNSVYYYPAEWYASETVLHLS